MNSFLGLNNFHMVRIIQGSEIPTLKHFVHVKMASVQHVYFLIRLSNPW